jgi:predicted porin
MFNLGEFSMKKTLVAIAALAATAAFAQSAVTLGGEIRFGYQKAPDQTAAVKSSTGFALTDATLKIGVVEDLGGGLKVAANTQLDQASSAFGNALNRRNTSLALMGSFGTVGFSQTRSSDLLTKAMVAPSNLPEGLYNTSGIVARAGIDGFGYTTPNLGGFTAGFSLVESTGDGTVLPTRRTSVLSADYSNGPLAVGVALKNTNAVNGAAPLAATARKSNFEAFGTYDLGVAKLGFGFDGKTTNGALANSDKSAISMGVAVPFGPATVGLNYAKRGTAKVTEFAVNYALSKRTSVNASFGNQSASAGSVAAVPGTVSVAGVPAAGTAAVPFLAKQSQYRISLAHTF